MKSGSVTRLSAALGVSFCTVAFAQTTQTPSTQAPAQPPSAQAPAQTPPTQAPARPAAEPTRMSADQQVTVSGCIQREADYRRSKNLGEGGAAGTGAGVGNEFVLVNASMAGSAGATAGTTGTSGTSSGSDYELSGTGEGKAAEFVGKRVEISGKLKAAEIGAAGPTGGATAGTPPTGVDVASKDLKLREIDVTSVKAGTGTCPAMP